MAAANEGDGSKMDVLKSVFSSNGSAAADDTTVAASNQSTRSAKRNSTFKIVPTRDSMLLPDAGHEKGWIRKASEKQDRATEGEGWKSSAYVYPLYIATPYSPSDSFSIVPEDAATTQPTTTSNAAPVAA
jgi:hypothetical protein